MIINYKNLNKLSSHDFGFSVEDGRLLFHTDKPCENIIFLNFPSIDFENITFKACGFKDCREISFHGCKSEECVFGNVSSVYAQYTTISRCSFTHCCSFGSLITLEEEGKVEFCVFNHISALGEDGYIIHFIYRDKKSVEKMKGCCFYDCEAENNSESFVCCEYLIEDTVYKTEPIDNIDYASCLVNDEAWKPEYKS